MFTDPTRRPIVLALILGCLIAILLAPQYGQSWDDEFDADKGRNAIEAYLGSPAYLTTENQRYYGPFHFMISAVAVRVVERLAPAWNPIDTRHVLNFGAFLLALPAFYMLASFFFNGQTCLVLLLLFTSQPLLVGHAFINQKDIPFMTGMLWTLVLGIQAVDIWKSRSQAQEIRLSSNAIHSILMNSLRDWQQQKRLVKVLMASVLLLGTFILLDFFGLHLIETGLSRIIRTAYDGHAWPPLQRAFNDVAQDAYKTPLSLYLDKLKQVILWFRVVIVWVYIACTALILRRYLLSFSASLGRMRRQGILGFILAGIALGLATAIRALAPFFGLLVVVYLIARLRRASVLPLLVYVVTGFTVAYLFWPYLWSHPVGNMLEALGLMSHFPPHQILYRGSILASDVLPWHYLPTLLTLQFTLPAEALILFGILLAGFRFRTLPQRGLLALLMLGATLPMAAVICLRTPIYGNFRQLLFVLPPLFLLAGFAIEPILRWANNRWVEALFLLMIVFPGISGVIRYHPYEYTFYNQLVGGTEGVNGYFDQDYWCTSYREAARYLNLNAKEDSIIMVAGPEFGVRNFSRQDLHVIPDWEAVSQPDYVVVCMQSLYRGFYGDLEVIYRAEREGAIFSEVKALAD